MMKPTAWIRFCMMALLLSSFIIIEAAPALAGDGGLQWVKLRTPEDGANGGWVIANNGGAGTEVNRIAIGSDGNTIYALDSVTPLLFKSGDGGYTWLNITGSLPAFTSLDDLAVSPDDPDFLVVVDATTPEVFISFDGGTTFSATGVAGLAITGTIQDVTVSASYNTGGGISRDIMFGTSNGAAGGQVWVMSIGTRFYNWTDVSTGAAGWLAADVFSLICSPNYHIDRTLLLIAADNTATPGDAGNPGTTWLCAGRVDVAAAQAIWNAALFANYPVAITRAGEDSPGTPLTYADLALPLDYVGANTALRCVYASWSDGIGGNVNDDVYRLNDTAVVRLEADGGAEFVAASLAYYGMNGEGKLLVGRRASAWAPPEPPSVQVRSTSDPQTRQPTWRNSDQPPTGVNEAQVAWSADGEVAFCGTGTIGGAANDESALSRSTDYGRNWNQTGLIDTVINTINDLEVVSGGDTLFMTTVNNGAASADSLWRSISSPLGESWARVLARSSGGTGDNPLVRIDPDYTDTGTLWYVNTDPVMAFQGLFLSQDGGNSWKSGFPNIVLVDLAAEDEDTVYGIDAAGLVSRGTKGGRWWGTPVNTGIGSGYSIACARTSTKPDNHKGNVIAGGTGAGVNSDIAYSTDGAATFIAIETLLPTRNNTLVTASSSYDSDGYILAINAGGMYAWGIFSGKDEWETWWGGAAWPSAVTGLQVSRNYGFYFATPATAWAAATPYARWAGVNAGLDANISLGAQPTGRSAISGGMALNEAVTYWVVDQRAYNPPQGGIWYYVDTLVWQSPIPVAPLSGSSVDYDPVSGRAGQIYITWESEPNARGYEIQIARDENFENVVADIGGGWAGPFYRPVETESPALAIPAGGGNVADGVGNTWVVLPLRSGETYYWRVRVCDVATGDAIKSPWSWAESFTVAEGMPVRAPHAS